MLVEKVNAMIAELNEFCSTGAKLSASEIRNLGWTLKEMGHEILDLKKENEELKDKVEAFEEFLQRKGINWQWKKRDTKTYTKERETLDSKKFDYLHTNGNLDGFKE